MFQPLEMKACPYKRSIWTVLRAAKCPLLVSIYFSLCNIHYTHILYSQDSSYRLNHMFQICLVWRKSGGRETSTLSKYLSEVMLTFFVFFRL